MTLEGTHMEALRYRIVHGSVQVITSKGAEEMQCGGGGTTENQLPQESSLRFLLFSITLEFSVNFMAVS